MQIENIDLELTNYCNLDCWMCPRKHMKRAVGYIGMPLVEKIASSARALGVKSMNLHMFGESILHPNLRNILELLRSHNKQVWLSFSTNATFLSEEKFELLIDLLDNLFISIDGMHSATYNRHRVNANFDKTFAMLKKVLAYRKKMNYRIPRFEIRMIELGQSEEEKRIFADSFTDLLLPDDAITIKPVESFAGSVEELQFIKKDFCPFLFSRVAIMWNGDLTTCCYDCHGQNVMGNISDGTIEDIFRSPGYTRLRDLYLSRQLQQQKGLLCHTCLKEGYSPQQLHCN